MGPLFQELALDLRPKTRKSEARTSSREAGRPFICTPFVMIDRFCCLFPGTLTVNVMSSVGSVEERWQYLTSSPSPRRPKPLKPSKFATFGRSMVLWVTAVRSPRGRGVSQILFTLIPLFMPIMKATQPPNARCMKTKPARWYVGRSTYFGAMESSGVAGSVGSAGRVKWFQASSHIVSLHMTSKSASAHGGRTTHVQTASTMRSV